MESPVLISDSLSCLTGAANLAYANRTALKGVGGFGRSEIRGAGYAPSAVYGFFYALLVMVAYWEAVRLAGSTIQSTNPVRCRPEFGRSDGSQFEYYRGAIMNTHTQVAPIALTISNISIRQDSEGRYCLNDLYKASGSNPKHKPSNWLRTQQTQDIITELEKDEAGIPASNVLTAHIRAVKKSEGRYGATYVTKELVYAYAMWISASFSLKVIRAYDALQSQAKEPPKPSIETFQVKILTIFTRGDEPSQHIVPYDSCVVSGSDLRQVVTFLNEFVPIELMPEILEAVSQRMARHFKSMAVKV